MSRSKVEPGSYGSNVENVTGVPVVPNLSDVAYVKDVKVKDVKDFKPFSEVKNTVFRLRCSKRELDRWRLAAGEQGVSAYLRSLANGELAAKVQITSLGVSSANRSPYDRDCKDFRLHWRGPCELCGGS